MKKSFNRIGGVMVSVVASSVVDRGFEPQSGQTKGYKIDICYGKHTALGRHVYPLTVVSVSWHYKNPTQRVGLVQSGLHHHLIRKLTCSRHDIAEKLLSWR